MLVGQLYIFPALKAESIFWNHISILVPMLTALLGYNCNRDIGKTSKFHPLIRLHSAFFKGFSFCRF